MKTIHPITAIIKPSYSWGSESSSYCYAIRAGVFHPVSSYQAGDILVAGSGSKRIFGKVHSIEELANEVQKVIITPIVDNDTVDDIGTRVRDIVPERYLTETIALREEYRPEYPEGYGFATRNWFATLDGAYQSILADSDVFVWLRGPEQVYTSLIDDPLTWEEYAALRRRLREDEERAEEVKKAIVLLRNIVRDCPHMLERVYPLDGEQATWMFEGIPLIDHDEDDPFLSALSNLLY